MGAMDFLTTRAGFGGLFDNSEDDALDQLRQNQDLYNQYQPKEVSFGNYIPEMASYQQINENPEDRQLQMQNLDELRGLAKNGYSDADNATFQAATGQANLAAKQNREALMNQAEARGVSNGGMQYALQEQANQDAMNRAHNQSLQQASESARNRALYQQAYGQGLQNLRNQDYTAQSNNADIINRFNQYNTTNANQGQQYNIQNAFNAAQQNNQNRANWLSGKAGTNTAMAQGYAAQNAARDQGRKQDTDTFMSGMKMFGGGA